MLSSVTLSACLLAGLSSVMNMSICDGERPYKNLGAFLKLSINPSLRFSCRNCLGMWSREHLAEKYLEHRVVME
uniref:Secreted protein n=1 Tax=Lotus japonicus TaxID=34305 RepID=I3T0W5_LOTJA|nr:unknown [Lotus japonicus]